MSAELQYFILGSYGMSLRYLVKEINASTGDLETANISAATGLLFFLRTPEHELIQKTATFVTDGSDGLLEYAFVAADLPRGRKTLVGQWEVQPQFTLSSFVGPLDPAQFWVQDCLRS